MWCLGTLIWFLTRWWVSLKWFCQNSRMSVWWRFSNWDDFCWISLELWALPSLRMAPPQAPFNVIVTSKRNSLIIFTTWKCQIDDNVRYIKQQCHLLTKYTFRGEMSTWWLSDRFLMKGESDLSSHQGCRVGDVEQSVVHLTRVVMMRILIMMMEVGCFHWENSRIVWIMSIKGETVHRNLFFGRTFSSAGICSEEFRLLENISILGVFLFTRWHWMTKNEKRSRKKNEDEYQKRNGEKSWGNISHLLISLTVEELDQPTIPSGQWWL